MVQMLQTASNCIKRLESCVPKCNRVEIMCQVTKIIKNRAIYFLLKMSESRNFST